MKPRYSSTEEAGLAKGFRSGLEDAVAAQLTRLGHPVSFETHTIQYEVPPRKAKYTPDFPHTNGVIIESKGRFEADDRQKHLLVKAQHPDLDIRFVFSRSKTPIRKGSKTTYADWCRKYGFQFADKLVPEAWLNEAPEPRRVAAMQRWMKVA
jgi:hypothetical protein